MDVQLSSFAQVVERYGRPNLTWSKGEEIVWVYGRDYLPESDSYRTQLRLHFQDGMVTQFYVDE